MNRGISQNVYEAPGNFFFHSRSAQEEEKRWTTRQSVRHTQICLNVSIVFFKSFDCGVDQDLSSL